MGYRKINYSPEALENKRAYAREYYHKHKDEPGYKEGRRAYDSIRSKNKERKDKNKIWKQEHPGYSKEQYHKDPERYRAYAEKARAKKPRIPRGKPGSIRFEARLAGYRSGFERTFATDLRLRSIEFDYESTKIPYVLHCEYNPDFYIKIKDFYAETKGVLDAADRRKHLAIKSQHPELDIRFIFMAADKKMSGSKQTHAAWATRHGFKWAEGSIPDEWLK